MSAQPVLTDIPRFSDIKTAQARIGEQVRRTPVLTKSALDGLLGCQLYFKCEHLQHTGAFKFRGACNAVRRLTELGLDGGVATHSSGNHGSALAAAARQDGRQAHIVMPENASKIKVDAVRRNGGVIHFCPPTQNDREAGLSRLEEEGFLPIPPYDHFDIIAGQGTAALELLELHGKLDCLLAPVGGGGLISGTALVASEFGLETYAAEPSGSADTAMSMVAGKRVKSVEGNTIADGLRALVGVRNFAVIRENVSQILTVSDVEIGEGMELFWRHTHMLIEPSSAVVIAAVKKYPGVFADRKVGLIITGSNIDPENWISITSRRIQK